MDEIDLDLAEQLGAALAQEGVDVNEVKKLGAFVRRRTGNAAGADMRALLAYQVAHPNEFKYSGKTTEYHKALQKLTGQFLCDVEDSQRLQFILGWAARLMRYYNENGAPRSGVTVRGTGPQQMRVSPSAPAAPAKGIIRARDELHVTIERVDGSHCFGKAKGNDIRFDQQAPALGIGDAAIVTATAEQDGVWTSKFKRRSR